MPRMGIGFLSYDVIWQKAEEFLSKYNAERKIPVPIEEIIEFAFHINIIPVPNLASVIEVEGFTSSNLKDIYVDEGVYSHVPTRYRFTLAHEMGHIILHRRFFERVKINSIVSWMDFYDKLENFERNALELQAYDFAGLVLVPRANLKNHVQDILSRPIPSIKAAKNLKILRSKYLPYVIEELATRLAPIYDVSLQTMTKRLNFDKLSRLIP
jgi:hypothetical protein